MRLIFTISTILCLAYSCSAQQFSVNTLSQSFFNKFKDKDVINAKDGNLYKVGKNSRAQGLYIKYKGSWVKHGVHFILNSKGKLLSKTTYQLGARHGIDESFYTNGKVKFSTNYKNGSKDGFRSQYNIKGALISTTEYKEDVINGEKLDYYVEEGRSLGVKTRTPYKNNVMHGDQEAYNKKGGLVSKTNYINGKKNGQTIYY